MNKRTDIDWSRHEVSVTEGRGFKIHHLAIHNSSHHNIKYINAGGVLSVTGDFGNWIFCREFHPSADGRVDAWYWDEKLQILSSQKAHEWDSERTREAWTELLNDPDQEWTDNEKNYIQKCIDHCGVSEWEYNGAAIDYPRSWDPEQTSSCTRTRRKFWLEAVYDGFDEICRRIKAMEELRKLSSPIPDVLPRKGEMAMGLKSEEPYMYDGDKWIQIKVEVGDYVLKAKEVILVKTALSSLHSQNTREMLTLFHIPNTPDSEINTAKKLRDDIQELMRKMS